MPQKDQKAAATNSFSPDPSKTLVHSQYFGLGPFTSMFKLRMCFYVDMYDRLKENTQM